MPRPSITSICLRSPAIRFRLFDESGLRIARQLIRPYEGKTEAESLAQSLPINVAYMLEKK